MGKSLKALKTEPRAYTNPAGPARAPSPPARWTLALFAAGRAESSKIKTNQTPEVADSFTNYREFYLDHAQASPRIAVAARRWAPDGLALKLWEQQT
jgi:hypothetical protein